MAVTANQPLFIGIPARLGHPPIGLLTAGAHVPELKTDYQRVFFGDNPPEIIYGSDEQGY